MSPTRSGTAVIHTLLKVRDVAVVGVFDDVAAAGIERAKERHWWSVVPTLLHRAVISSRATVAFFGRNGRDVPLVALPAGRTRLMLEMLDESMPKM